MAPNGAPGAFGLLLLLLSLASPRAHAGSPGPPGQGLLRALLARYHRGVRPAPAGGRPTVTVALELAQLISLDEKHEELTTMAFLDLRWRDPRLQWEPRLHGGLRVLRVPAELLWLPDVGLDNNNDGEFGVSLDVRAVVTPDGSVHWRPPALFRSHCPIKVSHFPFDWQNCSLRFRSGSYGPGELRLRLGGDPAPGGGPVVLSEGFQENGQWELWQRSGRAEALGAGVSFVLVLRRKPLFYLATVLVPCVLLTLLASAVFYLPPEAGEKLTLSLFALLTLTVFLLLLADKVPATSLALPLIARHLTATLLLLALGVALSVAVLNVHHRGPGTHRLPPALHRLLLQRLPPLLGLHCPPAPPLPPEPRPVLAPPGGSDDYFLRRPLPGAVVSGSGVDVSGSGGVSGGGITYGSGVGVSGFGVGVSGSGVGVSGSGPAPPPELREAAAAVAFIARSLREQQREQELQELWHRAALALDRLLLWAFLVLVGACGLGTGLDAALHRPPPEPFP